MVPPVKKTMTLGGCLFIGRFTVDSLFASLIAGRPGAFAIGSLDLGKKQVANQPNRPL
jgi:hypothetical protein